MPTRSAGPGHTAHDKAKIGREGRLDLKRTALRPRMRFGMSGQESQIDHRRREARDPTAPGLLSITPS